MEWGWGVEWRVERGGGWGTHHGLLGDSHVIHVRCWQEAGQVAGELFVHCQLLTGHRAHLDTKQDDKKPRLRSEKAKVKVCFLSRLTAHQNCVSYLP